MQYRNINLNLEEEPLVRQSGDRLMLKRLSLYIKPHLNLLILAACFLLVAMVLDLIRPILLKQTIDKAIPNQSFIMVQDYAILYFLTIIGSMIAMFIENYTLQNFGQRIIFEIRNAIFKKILSKSPEDFNKLTVGNLVTRVTNDTEALRTLYTDVVLKLITSTLMILGILVSMYFLNIKLAIVVTFLLPLMMWLIFIYQKYARRAFRGLRTKLAASNSSVQEMLNFIVIIKSYVGEKIISQKYEKISKDYLEAGLFEVKTFAIFRPLVDGLFFVAIIAILGFTNWFDDVIEAGTVFAFLQYMNKFFQPLKDIAEKYNSLQSSLAGAERIIPLLEEKEYVIIKDEIIPNELKDIQEIVFQNVSFKYPNSDIYALRNINITIKAGEFIGIAGASGAGKSTLMNLLMGFYVPTEGEILLNGHNYRNYSSRIIREIIGYVFQDSHLFKGTIKENLTLYNDKITDEELDRATSQAQLDKMINRLPQGLNTPVGYLGSLLSSGEKQLLALARVLIKNKKILIFDEATANIDSHTEEAIQKSIEAIRGEKTIISIAHRLSTIKNADQILLIENGEIIEQGSFTALIEQRGKFYNFWKE